MGQIYRCTKPGPHNNGWLPDCKFQFEFDPEGSYSCPQCGSLLERMPTGPSISELLRRGWEDEQRQKAAAERPAQSKKEDT